MYDAIVVGARCAGSTTARLLAEQGRRVLVIDRATFPSDTVSTHCIGSGGVELLRRWGLFDSIVATGIEPISNFTVTIGTTELANAAPTDDGQVVVSPRRTVLDKLLLDAARDAGAEVREGVTLRGLLRSDSGSDSASDDSDSDSASAVIGITATDADGNAFDERARIVIGADGVHSAVAKSVDADTYDVRPGKGSGFYAYYSSFPMEAVELAFNRHHFSGIFPTNDGQACVFAGKTDDEFASMRDGQDEALAEVCGTTNPRIGEAVRAAKRESRFFAFRSEPGFFRKPYGQGWALVGDAGYYLDPVTGQGITDAFRDSLLLTQAIAAGDDGGANTGVALADALAGYQQRRDDMSRVMFETTQEMAALGWDDQRLLELFMTFGATIEQHRLEILAL